MPRGDGTGPAGLGPMSGRGMGFCAGYRVAGYANNFGFAGGPRRNPMGAGGYFGRGRGYRNQFYAAGIPGWMRYGSSSYDSSFSKEDEIEMLRNQAENFKNTIDDINKRLYELNKEDSL